MAKKELKGGDAHHQKHTLEKISIERTLKHKILLYSAIKINAKGPAEYSILNPDTSSDSPSAKSKGARFVSASRVTPHTKKKRGEK